jgi:DNA anti-recombination protein RmuC
MDTIELDAGTHLPEPQSGATREPNTVQMPSAQTAADTSLDQIRDILFGAVMRDTDKKLARLEERLLKEQEDLKEDARHRFESLEVFVKKEMESLAERLQAGHITRDEALRALTQELKEVVSGFEKRTTQLDEQTAKAQRELRQQILDQSKTLRDEYRGQYRQLSEAVSRALHDLRVEKADRAALAALLSELAMRLRHDLALPVSE